MRLIIGIDVSKTTQGFDRADTTFFRQIIDASMESGRTVEIAFRAIGNPTDRSFSRIRIHSLPFKGGTMSDQKRERIQNEINAIKAENALEVARFMREIAMVLQKPDEDFTDLNGFLARSNNLIAENTAIRTLIYLQTDGLHDANNTQTLNCAALHYPCFIAVSGWKNPERCKFDATTEAPAGFLTVLRTQLVKP